MPNKINDTRRDFEKGSLLEADLPKDPYLLLESWVQHALNLSISDANAMNLATVDANGFPTSRIVLARGISANGIKFFTNYDSLKGQELNASNKASVNFFWSTLERQVRVLGHVSKISAKESDEYFASRPRESQLGAWTSPQSKPILNRDVLDRRFQEMEAKFSQVENIPRPDHWGGFILKPISFEFWQGRASRLHDRLVATLIDSEWKWQRLAP